MFTYLTVFAALISAPASADRTPACAETRAEFKIRFDKIPKVLQRLGGERHVSRRYLAEPHAYLEDGVTTACAPTAAASDMRVDPKMQCPQTIAVTFNFPSAMARDPKSAVPIDTVYFSLTLSTIGPAPHIELPLDSFKFTDSGFTAEAPNRSLVLKTVDATHAYLEWTQKSEVASLRTQRVLIESDAVAGDFDRAVPIATECR